LVRLDVRVMDGEGRPIGDLRPDEIQILDGGERRPVLLFQHVAESGRSYAESAQRTIAAEVSTNQGAPRGQLYVLLFDQQHITAGTEQRVRQAAERFLRTHLRPQDRVAVYGLPGPGPALSFTANVKAAIDQLQHVRGGLERMVTSPIGDMTLSEAYQIARGNAVVLQRFMTPSSQNGTSARTSAFADLVGTGRGSMTTDQMERMITDNARTIVSHADAESRSFLRLAAAVLKDLQGIDGRKTVVLFTEGFYGDNLDRDLQIVSAAAAETYSVIYAFDLNHRAENFGGEAQGGEQASDVMNRLEPIGSLAAETNGALVNDALSRLDQALTELGDANTDYYILGFTPRADALANRDTYERVTVRVTRPGAHVSTRTGYAAGPAPTLADRRRAIDTALGAPFSQQGLRVDYTTYISRADVAGAERVVLSLEAELPVSRPDTTDPADVVFAVRNSHTGQVAASGSDQIPLPKAAVPGSSTGRSPWHVQFNLAPGDYLMRCVVREPGGLVGSADRHFTVRSLTGPDLAASDLVLRSFDAALPVRALAYTDAPLSGAVRVYGRTLDQLSDLSGRLELIGIGSASADAGDSPTLAVNAAIGDARDTGAETQRDVMFSVPLDRVPAGEYVARAVIRSRGEIIADLRRQVNVIAGAVAARPAPAEPARPRDVTSGSISQRLVTAAGKSADTAVRRAAESARDSQWTDVLGALADAPAADQDAARLRGLALLGLERYTDAATQFTATFTARPDDAALAFLMGWASIGAGDDRAAITAFRNAVLREPAMVPAHLALAETYLRLKQPALAVQALEAGLTVLPDAPELKRMLETIKK
jgi:VWFA-related protein